MEHKCKTPHPMAVLPLPGNVRIWYKCSWEKWSLSLPEYQLTIHYCPYCGEELKPPDAEPEPSCDGVECIKCISFTWCHDLPDNTAQAWGEIIRPERKWLWITVCIGVAAVATLICGAARIAYLIMYCK